MTQEKLRAVFTEMCFLLGVAMVVLWTFILMLWKTNAVNLGNPYIVSLIIWGFKMGFAGGVHMAIVPVLRHTLDQTMRSYHFPAVFIGLCVLTYTGYNLNLSTEFDFGLIWYLGIPMFMTWAMMTLKNRSGGLTTNPNAER